MSHSARFIAAFDHLISPGVEGFYSNDPHDQGGETVWGVARRYWPNWWGWVKVDAWKREIGFPVNMKNDQRIIDDARDLYREHFWNRVQADHLPSMIGEKLFEMAVNIDHETAIVVLQIALVALENPIVIDGGIGPKTLAAVSATDPHLLYDVIQAGQGCFYVGRRNARYLRGWLNRALSEPEIAALRRIQVEV